MHMRALRPSTTYGHTHLSLSSSMRIILMAVIQIVSLLKLPQLWRYAGFMSSVVGVLCYALSSSFEQLFGEWNLLKIFLYGAGSFIICTFMLFAKKWKLSSSVMLKAHMGFLVLMVTSVYSFFYDKAVKGKADVLGLISCGAFAFVSFSLSRQIELGFEVDLLNFFLGFFTVQLMKINLMLAFVGAFLCYFFILLRSSLDSQAQHTTGIVTITDHVAVQVDAENGLDNTGFISGDTNHQQKLSSLRKRKTAKKLMIKVPSTTGHFYTPTLDDGHSRGWRDYFTPTLEDDGHSWRKYGQEKNRGCTFPRSYYKCTRTYDQGCHALKQVQQIQEYPVMFQITYIGLHTCKDTLKAPHLVVDSFNRESFLMNTPLDSKVPNEHDHPILSTNSSSIIEQEYPKGDTPTDHIDHKLDPSQWSDLEDLEVFKPDVMALNMASDNADTVHSCINSQNLDVDFGMDESSTHNSRNNEDERC